MESEAGTDEECHQFGSTCAGNSSITQNSELFNKYLEPLILTFLKDRVSAIRGAAIERIPELAKNYGVNWINSFVGKLSDVIAKDPCFHFKIAAIYSLKEICLSVHG
jgi:hypothetical protein